MASVQTNYSLVRCHPWIQFHLIDKTAIALSYYILYILYDNFLYLWKKCVTVEVRVKLRCGWNVGCWSGAGWVMAWDHSAQLHVSVWWCVWCGVSVFNLVSPSLAHFINVCHTPHKLLHLIYIFTFYMKILSIMLINA